MKENLLSPAYIAEAISCLVSKNKLWENKKVVITVIANKTAGCFTHRKKSTKLKNILADAVLRNLSKPTVTQSVESKIYRTKYANHARELTDAVIAEYAALDDDIVCLLVTAGGDGTCQEVQTALIKAAYESETKRNVVMNKITILRLPLGTGNDGTDGHSLEETIELLEGPLHFANAKAVKVYYEGNPTEEQIKAYGKDPRKFSDKYDERIKDTPWFAFNITSIGIDAYVAYLTDFIKKRLPGNFYHLCVPLSGLLYDPTFPPGTGRFELYDKDGNKTEEITTPIEMFTVGASGYRVYGGGHVIFPNHHNVCVTPKLGLLRLMLENHHFVDGSFGPDLATLHTAEKIKIYYDKPIIMETDGETMLLVPEHFPLIMERTEPCIRILESDNQTIDKGTVRAE